MKKITIYSTNNCHFCNLAKDFFKANDLEYTEHNVGEDMAKRQEMMELTHQLGVPVIRIDDTVVVGFQEQKVAEILGIAA
ncbi:MAG TPA: glutaredoxin family protein [Candidatus Paceibacterota bacterium]